MPRPSASPSAAFWRALGLITLLGGVIRVVVAATEPPHFDESYTAVRYVLGSIGTILTTYDEPNNHLFHSVLAWGSTGLFGDGAFALRLPALVAGVLLVPAVGVLARGVVAGAGAGDRPSTARANGPAAAPAALTIGNRGAAAAGLVAAAIAAGAPPLIAYSANARGYAVAMLLMVAQLWLSVRLAAASRAQAATVVDRSPAGAQQRGAAGAAGAERPRAGGRWGRGERRGHEGGSPASGRAAMWGAWVVCGALAVWTVPTAVVGVLVATIWLVALRWSPGPGRGVLAVAVHAVAAPVASLTVTGLVTLGLYAPVLGQRGFTVDRFTAAPVRELVTTLGHAWTAGLAIPLIAVAILLALVGVARRPRLGTQASLALGLAALPLAIAVLGRVLPYSRTYLFLLPILAVLAGVGAARVAPWIAARGRAVATLAGAGFAAIALAAGLGAQTRATWAEDPPGPPQRDLLLAERDALVEALTELPAGGPDAVLGAPVAVPPFNLPQAQYALAADGLRASEALVAYTAQPGAGFRGLILARRDVRPVAALVAVGLDPAAYATEQIIRGDAQAIVAKPR